MQWYKGKRDYLIDYGPASQTVIKPHSGLKCESVSGEFLLDLSLYCSVFRWSETYRDFVSVSCMFSCLSTFYFLSCFYDYEIQSYLTVGPIVFYISSHSRFQDRLHHCPIFQCQCMSTLQNSCDFTTFAPG